MSRQIGNSNAPRFLYVMRSADGFIKVGIATSPAKRLASLQTANPMPISIINTFGPFNDALRLELSIHKKLANIRKSGEWFDGGIVDILNAVEYCMSLFEDTPDPTEEDLLIKIENDKACTKEFHRLLGTDRVKDFSFQKMVEFIDQVSTTRDKWEENYNDALDLANYHESRCLDYQIEIDALENKVKILEAAIQPSLLN